MQALALGQERSLGKVEAGRRGVGKGAHVGGGQARAGTERQTRSDQVRTPAQTGCYITFPPVHYGKLYMALMQHDAVMLCYNIA